MNNEPVFIIGVPRSGTTLLAAILAAHSRISCGPETHFFRKLANVDAQKLIQPETWPQAAVDFVCSIEHASFSNRQPIPLIEKYQINRWQISEYLSHKDPSISNVLSSVTGQYMQAMGKERWVEKTPDHILTLDQLRAAFPDSPIIRILRDPRDVAISLTKVPWGALSFLDALLLWKRMDAASERFFASDRLCYSLRYEDLITSPESELTKLCQFIGEEFEPGMLDTSQTGKQLNSRHVPWKEKVSQPIDPSRLALWKQQLSITDNQLAEAILGDRLKALEYPIEGDYVRLGEVYPSISVLSKYSDGIKVLASSGVRFWKSSPDEKTSARVFVGDPVNDGWLLGNKIRHILDALTILISIIKARLSGESIYWITGNEMAAWSGYSAFLLKKVLSPYIFPPSEGRNHLLNDRKTSEL